MILLFQIHYPKKDYNHKRRNDCPNIIYIIHDGEAANYNTNIELFENEMKYLHDNNFRAITMRDLGYEENSDYLYIKSPQESSLAGGIASVSSDNKLH